jgi:hypothetical protein
VVGLAYPLLVVVVTVTTDNHFVTDAVVGLLVVGTAIAVARLVARRPVTARMLGDWADTASGSAPAPSPAAAPLESRSP